MITPTNEGDYTPKNKDWEYSALTNFAHSLLEKLSRRDDGESTKSNDNLISNKTNYNGRTTDSGKKSWKKRSKHRRTFMKHTQKNVIVDGLDKSGNISDLGSRIFKMYQKPQPSARPIENSVEVEKDAQNTARSIDIQMKRRRSKTGDQIRGLSLKDKQVGNFVDRILDEYSKIEI